LAAPAPGDRRKRNELSVGPCEGLGSRREDQVLDQHG
jgi:hypothetical protein